MTVSASPSGWTKTDARLSYPSAWQSPPAVPSWMRQENPHMTIQLPNDVERDTLPQVQGGRFASVHDALTEAWREYRRHRQSPPTPNGPGLLAWMPTEGKTTNKSALHA
jgi:hypothetical protein